MYGRSRVSARFSSRSRRATPSARSILSPIATSRRQASTGRAERIVEGKVITSANGLHFLVDSSPEVDEAYGQAFRIFIPWVVAWGYPWSRSGREFIHDGSFVNIRAFAKPYADYSAGYRDNPYIVHVSQGRIPAESAAPGSAVTPVPVSALASAVPRDRPASFDPKLYIPETIASFGAIASAGGGELRYASSAEDIAAQIEVLLEGQKGKTLDLVICVDTTDTMAAALEALKQGLPSVLERRAGDFPSLRLGMVAFKDYFEEYLYKRFDFVSGRRKPSRPSSKASRAEEAGISRRRSTRPSTRRRRSSPGRQTSGWPSSWGTPRPIPCRAARWTSPSAEEEARRASVELDAVAVPK